MEQKKIFKEVNDKYDNIKNDLPIPFSLDKIKIDKLIHSNNEQCSICLKEYIEENQVLYLPCSHLFHSICILKWLLNNNKCPICQTDYRAKIRNEKKEDEDGEEREENINNNMIMNNYNIFRNNNFMFMNNNMMMNNNEMMMNNLYMNQFGNIFPNLIIIVPSILLNI